MIDWDQLVKERNEWVEKNFPPKLEPPLESTMGIMEEAGELAHSHLKELQGIRGTAAEHQANARDAIGDISVYLLGVMNAKDVRPQLAATTVVGLDSDRTLLHIGRLVGLICECISEDSVQFLGWKVSALVRAMDHYCLQRGWDYDEIVNSTWAQVKQRDWVANPLDGNEGPKGLDYP